MPPNKLNNLDPKTWLKFQKSWFVHNPPPRKKGVLVHPAKFPETMAQEFIEFFTKQGETVLDPDGRDRVGAGGRAAGRTELVRRRAEFEICADRTADHRGRTKQHLGDSRSQVSGLKSSTAMPHRLPYGLPSLIMSLTSPPYWDMLRAKARKTRRSGAPLTELDVHYSDDPNDLGNIEDYEAFVEKLVISTRD
jgi:hypothetical protein